jgi:hypothetical protein
VCLCAGRHEHASGANSAVCTRLVRTVLDAVSERRTVLVRHPCAQVYSVLSSFSELKPGTFYLESAPCAVCHSLEQSPWSAMKLRDIEEETKHTAFSRVMRLRDTYAFQSISFRLTEVSPVRAVVCSIV